MAKKITEEHYFKQHRISQAKKLQNDAEWAKDWANYCIPSFAPNSQKHEEYKEMLSNFRLYNNEIDQEELQKACNRLNIKIGQIEDEIKAYNKTPNKVNVIVGEELKRDEKFRPVLQSGSDLTAKSQELYEAIDAKYKDLINQIAEIMQNSKLSPEQQQDRLTKLNAKYADDTEFTDFKSKKERIATHIINYGEYHQDVKRKKSESFKYGLLTGRPVVWVGLERGVPVIKVRNTINTFEEKAPDEPFGHNGVYAGVRWFETREEIIENYGSSMKPEELRRYEIQDRQYKGMLDDEITFHKREAHHWANFQKNGSPQVEDRIGGHYSEPYKTGELFEIVHIEFRTVQKVGFFSTFNDFMEEQIEVVSEEFPIPDDAQEIEYTNRFGDKNKKYEWYDDDGEYYVLEWLWVPRIWEATRIDGDIWHNVRPKPGQYLSVIDPYGCARLGYHSLSFSAMNARNMAPFSRMKPFQFLLFIVMHQMVKLIARNFGTIPFYDLAQLPIFKNKIAGSDMEMMLYYMQEGLGFSDSSVNSEGSANRGRAVESIPMSNMQDITNLANIADWLNGQIGEAIGISPEREARFSPYSNVADNQQALAQSASITEELFAKHSVLWREVMDSYVKCFQQAVRLKEKANPYLVDHTFNYVLPNGSMEMFKLDRGYLSDSEFGIFMADSGALNRYRDNIEQLLLPLIQNKMEGADLVSTILKSRHEGASPEQVHEMIMKHLKKNDELRQQEIASAQKNADIQRQMAAEAIEAQHANEMAKIDKQAQHDKDLVMLEAMLNAQHEGGDADGIPTSIEVQKVMAEIEKLRADARNANKPAPPKSSKSSKSKSK